MKMKYLILLAAAILTGCTNPPLKPDLTDSSHLLVKRQANTLPSVANVKIVNNAPATKLVNSSLGSDSFIPFHTDPPIRKVVEDDLIKFVSNSTTINPLSEKSITFTITKANGYWVWGGVSKVPFAGILTINSEIDYILDLRILCEIEIGGKVSNSFTIDESFTIQNSAATQTQLELGYTKLIAAYRETLYSTLRSRFLDRYL